MSTTTGNGMHVQPSLGDSLKRVVLVTAAILMVPLIAMQFTDEVEWTAVDFIAAGTLLLLAGLALTVALRTVRSTRGRLLAVGLIGLGFLYCWAEMAVGIFTNIGS
jgi:hypothetical protein